MMDRRPHPVGRSALLHDRTRTTIDVRDARRVTRFAEFKQLRHHPTPARTIDAFCLEHHPPRFTIGVAGHLTNRPSRGARRRRSTPRIFRARANVPVAPARRTSRRAPGIQPSSVQVAAGLVARLVARLVAGRPFFPARDRVRRLKRRRRRWILAFCRFRRFRCFRCFRCGHGGRPSARAWARPFFARRGQARLDTGRSFWHGRHCRLDRPSNL